MKLSKNASFWLKFKFFSGIQSIWCPEGATYCPFGAPKGQPIVAQGKRGSEGAERHPG